MTDDGAEGDGTADVEATNADDAEATNTRATADADGAATVDADETASDPKKRRLWLVDRSFRGENLVTLVYADIEGSVHRQKQLSHALLTSKPVTAAIDVPVDDVEPVPAGESDHYATQAARMAAEHGPDDEV